MSLYDRGAATTATAQPYSSSYGSSFSENVGIIGNQIQIQSPQANVSSKNLIEKNSQNASFGLDINLSNSNKFSIKFSEIELKE